MTTLDYEGRVEALIAELKELSTVYQPDTFGSPSSVSNYLTTQFAGDKEESMRVLFLNTKNHLIDTMVTSGTVNHATIYPREVAKKALMCNATGVILAHNHPTGECTPSRADLKITKVIVKALKTIEVKCLDHVIVGSFLGKYMSFSEQGLI